MFKITAFILNTHFCSLCFHCGLFYSILLKNTEKHFSYLRQYIYYTHFRNVILICTIKNV